MATETAPKKDIATKPMTDRPRRAPELPAIGLIDRCNAARAFAWLLGVMLVSLVFALIFVPWRQAVTGQGKVIGFTPLDRQQQIDATITGRVKEWFVQEGSMVKSGDKIALMVDNDPDYVARLLDQKKAITMKRDAALEKLRLYGTVVKDYESYRTQLVQAAQKQVEVAEQKVKAEEQELGAAKIAASTDGKQYQRIAELHKEGLESRRALEMADQKYQESSAKAQKAAADLAGAKGLVDAKKADLRGYEAEAGTKIGTARSSLQESQISVGEYEKELREILNKISRQETQLVTAPRDGTILRLLVAPGEQLKQGDAIALEVPDTISLAVEIEVDGNDAPLISDGRHVRLQFEGWPAVQFPGWPSVAVGTFGGIVSLVDSSDLNDDGKFRVLVVPDPAEQENPATRWPSKPWLRQGVRARGWVLLNQVSLGYELWRQLNGFPPIVSKSEPGQKAAKVKLPKS